MEIPELTSKTKFASYDKFWNEVAHDYGKVFEEVKEINQLKIGASQNQIDLLLKLTETINHPFYILYVLVVTRIGSELGRYQSPLLESKDELKAFLKKYQEYFETDGRHHVWICTLDNSGRFIYDQHNVIFAYGQLDKYISILEKNGFKQQEFTFPAPHAHAYNESNDKFEEGILKHWDWDYFPLADGDEY